MTITTIYRKDIQPSMNKGSAEKRLSPPIIILIASSHCEVRRNKLAPMAYAYVTSFDPAHVSWGFGGARETKEMLAHGLCRSCEQALLQDQDAMVEVVVQRDGFTRYLNDFIPQWRRQMTTIAFERYNFRTWERLHTLWGLGNISVREPNEAEARRLDGLQKFAKQIARGKAYGLFAKDPLSYTSAGVYGTDEGEGGR